MNRRVPRWVAQVLIATGAAACGGGDSSSGDGSGAACERVSSGSSSLTIRNQLSSGLRAHLPQFAFGADMASGECNIVGLEYSALAVDVRIEFTQCMNSASDTSCGALFGPTTVRTINLPRGEARSVSVDAASFAPNAPMELLANGSFEAPAIAAGTLQAVTAPSWSGGALIMNPSSTGAVAGNAFTWPQPADGQQYSNIGNTAQTALAQSFTLASAGTYTMVWQDNTGLSIAPGFQRAPYRMTLMNSASQPLFTIDRDSFRADGRWSVNTVVRALGAGTYSLSFTSLNAANQTDTLIDAVSVRIVP